MAWQDRSYYRDRGSSPMNPLMWLVSGSIPLFTVFGIRVRAHASLVVYVALVLLFGLGPGFTWQARLQHVGVLFAIVLLHEFGHCFAARWVGGTAEDILMHPLGGFAMSRPPRRPLATFITVAGGPAVNVLICIIAGAILWALTGWLPWNPLQSLFYPNHMLGPWYQATWYVYWVYSISYSLLMFNLIPIYPLDGGQILQTALWPKFGYYRSMLWSLNGGMVAAVLVFMIGIAGRQFNFAVFGALGFMMCFVKRRELIANGPEEWGVETDYSAAYESPNRPVKRRKKINHRAIKRARKLAMEAQAEQKIVDEILAKVSAQGMHSLNWSEKRALRKATERQRTRDAELRRL